MKKKKWIGIGVIGTILLFIWLMSLQKNEMVLAKKASNVNTHNDENVIDDPAKLHLNLNPEKKITLRFAQNDQTVSDPYSTLVKLANQENISPNDTNVILRGVLSALSENPNTLKWEYAVFSKVYPFAGNNAVSDGAIYTSTDSGSNELSDQQNIFPRNRYFYTLGPSNAGNLGAGLGTGGGFSGTSTSNNSPGGAADSGSNEPSDPGNIFPTNQYFSSLGPSNAGNLGAGLGTGGGFSGTTNSPIITVSGDSTGGNNNPGGAAPVPEPATLILLGSGLLGIGIAFRKKIISS